MKREPYFSPKKENEFVEKILSILDSEYCTEQIPLRPESYCRHLNCFPNVDEKVRRDGDKAH